MELTAGQAFEGGFYAGKIRIYRCKYDAVKIKSMFKESVIPSKQEAKEITHDDYF